MKIKLLIVANNSKWVTWTDKIKKIKDYFSKAKKAEIDFDITIRHTNYASVPFVPYTSIDAAQNKISNLMGVDPVWYDTNITPLALGYNVVLFQLNRNDWKEPNKARGWRTDADQGVIQLQIGCNENTKGRMGFDELAQHEIQHALYMISSQKDNTHLYYDARTPEKARDEIVFQQKSLVPFILKAILYGMNLLALRKQENPFDLLPLVARKANALVEYATFIGTPIRVTEGYRSIERQNQLYAQGRTLPGVIVTNAKGGESNHNYGIAFDIVFRKEGYNATSTQWKAIADHAKKLGLAWGGDWKNIIDKPHFELTFGYTLDDFKKGAVDLKKYE